MRLRWKRTHGCAPVNSERHDYVGEWYNRRAANSETRVRFPAWSFGKHKYGEESKMIRCLVVDSLKEHVDTLVDVLSMYGCEARGETCYFEGMRQALEWEPHLIIYDDLMEEKRAWEFGLDFLRKEPRVRPYMVSITACGSILHRRLCEECGFDGYETKPIDLSNLLTWVQKARVMREMKKTQA